jgi:two-component system CheB/CheR fusion protein
MPTGRAPTEVFHQKILSTGSPLRVVGIGASAGAVEAFTRLLKALPADSGMAFVLLSHLSPKHTSELSRLFAPLTRMPVQDAIDGTIVLPNQVYVLPPDRILTIADGRLRLKARDASDVIPTAIDQFFQSLALERGPAAVGVVLTGTGSDGTAGIQAIKSHGGHTYAQDPATATFDSMPRSAIESGAVDYSLSLEGIAAAIAGLGQPEASAVPDASPATVMDWNDEDEGDLRAPLSDREMEALQSIITFLQSSTGVDFHHYKRASLTRRIRRRAEEAGVHDLVTYLELLRREPTEVGLLFQTVLIQVTRFFRESATFETLKETVIPALTTGRAAGMPVRVWVVGCSTGEEVYSLAIAFMEVEAALGVEVPVRIFASDVSDSALATARQGHYPQSITEDVSAQRLEQFFTPVSQKYQVNKRIREMCVFARHDITRDPPFAQLDLVVCCNVLIYLDPVLQRRLLHNMHYALKAGGYLLLGPAETTTGVEGLFSPFDRQHKIYQRRPGPAKLHVSQFGVRTRLLPAAAAQSGPGMLRSPGSTGGIQRAAEQAFFTLFPAASIVVNQEFDVLHYQGVTTPFLQPPNGAPTSQLLRLAHPDLQLVLGRLLRRVKKEKAPARQTGVSFGTGKEARQVNLTVLPVPLDELEEEYYLVVFEAVPGKAASREHKASSSDTFRMQELEAELAESKEYLRTFIDQQDAANAEVQAAYEASLSVNEEYQSTNEELESAQEELQSLNEELTTVNEQLQLRNAEIQARSAEVSGLLEALDMPILLLTRNLRLAAFNSRAALDYHLTKSKVGHGLGDTSLPVSQTRLLDLVECAFSEGEVQELEILGAQGRWLALRVWPLESPGHDGTAAIAFVDIHRLKTNIAEEHDARSYSEAVVETILEPLVVLDESSRMLHANRAFHQAFGTDAKTFGVQTIGELGGEDWDPAVIDAFLVLAAQSNGPLEGPEISLNSSRLGRRIFQLGAGTITWQGPRRILLALKDVTERKLAEEAALETSRMQAVGQLAGGVAHEINNQMTVVIGLATFLLRDTAKGDPRGPDLSQILKAADRSAAISQQLLAFSRRQMLQPVVFDLNGMVGMAETSLKPLLRPDITIEVVLGDQVGQVRADLAQMEQLLANLAVNARDAMPGSGCLRIETTTIRVTEAPANVSNASVVPRGVYARLIVSDTGHGMDAATKARIFEPFFTTKGIGRGTGLGLASVYGVVKQSGGLIWVDSEIGKGTTFTIDLPQVQTLAPPPKTEAEPTALVGGNGTILVVDDQEQVRAWVTRSLREMGYSTLEAQNGLEVLRLLGESNSEVDLVISDVSMPGMHGGELRKRLAVLRPDLPILFMSGFAREDLVSRGSLEAGTPILVKPFTSIALGARVGEAMKSSIKT